MELRNLLQLTDARFVEIGSYPSETGVKCVLVLAASLLPETAKLLGCDYIYKKGVPVPDLDGVKLDGQLRDVELHLPTSFDRKQFDTYFPELIHKFSLTRIEDAKFEVRFRVHEASRCSDLLSLLESVNKDSFECAIRPRQGELFEGGTRVEMSGTSTHQHPAEEEQPDVFACRLCDEDVPLDDTGTQHIDSDGVVTACEHPSARAVAAVRASRGRRGSLASKREISHA
jgi:hypothetical protein